MTTLFISPIAVHASSEAKTQKTDVSSGTSGGVPHVGVPFMAMGIHEPHARIEELTKSAAGGNLKSMDRLGRCYEGGLGVKKDYNKSYEWYQRAVTHGDAEAMMDLGLMYANGEGVPKDYSHAIDLFRKSARLNDADAMGELGVTYMNGLWGVKRDYGQAMKWFRRGAVRGNYLSMLSIAYMYRYGLGVQASQRKYAQWLIRVVSDGSVINGKKLDQLYPDLGWEADQGLWRFAVTKLGECYNVGVGVKKDPAKAVQCFLKGAKAGEFDSMDELALAQLQGRGTKRAPKKSIQWLRKATSMGDGRAMYIFGLMYEQGDGVNEDKSEAIKWFRKAVKAGNKRAKAHLQALQTAATQRSVKGK